jgi:ArsR family transcriptional regulator, arsenate/arsenite/antimonite-responsive transcriptional repressor
MLKSPPMTMKLRPDRLFRAMADPTRLAILRLLRPGERCVCDIVVALRVPQPTASRHLAYLRRAGLTEVRRQGQWSYYKLSEPVSELHRRLLDCLQCCPEVRSPAMGHSQCSLTRIRRGSSGSGCG